jgi:SAM-dependent methyltransferase
MSTFDLYAAYYDLLYRDKDYSEEVDYVNSLILAHRGVQELSILELGCGTGGHATYLAKSGQTVYGIDVSPQMVKKAKDNLVNIPLDLAKRLTFRSLMLPFRYSMCFVIKLVMPICPPLSRRRVLI